MVGVLIEMFELLFKVNVKVSRDFQLYADTHGKFFYFVEIKIKTYYNNNKNLNLKK